MARRKPWVISELHSYRNRNEKEFAGYRDAIDTLMRNGATSRSPSPSGSTSTV